MAVKQIDLYVTQLIEDLNSGLTWYKKDDLGYGSVEVKYGANEKQITAIRKHPMLKNAETSLTVFNVIDDTKTVVAEPVTKTVTEVATSDLDAFANL